MEGSLKELLIKYGFTLKKSLGQNFLSGEHILDAIVDKGGITESDTVVEIGCGAGTLTEKLAKRCKKVYGFEVDNTLKKLLNDRFDGFNNVQIIFKDIMKMDTAELESMIGGEYKVVANLPYYITTPILMKFLEEAKNIKSMVVMVQKEVAFRLSAKAGSSDYGAITAAIDFRADADIIVEVPRYEFLPPPKVDSAVVRIDFGKTDYQYADKEYFRKGVKIAFGNRRKTLVNNLINSCGMSRADAEEMVVGLGYQPLVRGEALDTSAFVKLGQALKEKGY